MSDEERAALVDETAAAEDAPEEANEAAEDRGATEEVDESVAPEKEAKAADPAPTNYDPPQFAFQAPEGAEARVAEIDASLLDLGQKLTNDEIEIDQYHARMLELTKERADLASRLSMAGLVEQMNQQSAQQAWSRAQATFFAAHQDYQDPVRYAALDAAVKTVAQRPESNGAPYSAILDQAHAEVRRAFGVSASQPVAQATPPAATAAPAAAPKSAPTVVQIPPTLGDIPVSGANDTAKDPYAHLDNLSGLDLEHALARMPADQAAAYLRG